MSDIIHQANQQQFICMVEGKESRLRYRRLDAKTIDAYSTFVPPSCGCRGLPISWRAPSSTGLRRRDSL